MLAAIFKGPGQMALEEIPTPHAGPGELLLKVGANTVCGTDVRILRGEKSAGIDRGVVLGHEIAGRIAEVGEGVKGYSEGDLCAVSPEVTCGICHYCLHGQEHLCLDQSIVGYRINGGLAEYMLVPEQAVARRNVIVAKKQVPAEYLALAEPLSCVLNGLAQYKVFVGDTVLILGAGPIGLLHQSVVQLAGASQVIVSDVSAGRRATAAALGATTVVDPLSENLGETVKQATDGRGADVVVICIGRLELFADSLKLVRKGGRVSAFAGFPAGGSVPIDPNLVHYGEITLTGASNSRRENVVDAMRLIESGRIPAEQIVTHKFPLTDVIAGIEFSAGGEGIKVAIVP